MVEQGLSLGAVASVIAVGQIMALVAEVPSGAIADTIGHRKSLVISLLGQAVSSLLFLGGSFAWIVTATILYNLFASLMTGTSEALFFDYVKHIGREKEHLKLWGQGKAVSRSLNMVSTFLGGATYGIHPALPFLLAAVQFAFAGVVIAKFPRVTEVVSVEVKEGFAELVAHFPRAIRMVYHRRFVFWIMVMNALLLGSIIGTNDFQQIVFSSLGATATFIGGVYTFKRFIAMVVSGFVYKVANVSPRTVMMTLLVLLLFYMGVTPFVHSFAVYAVVVLLASVVYASLEILMNDWMNQAIPSTSRATTLSLVHFMMSMMAILSALLFGFIGGDPAWTYPVLGVLILVLSIVPLARMGSGVLAKE